MDACVRCGAEAVKLEHGVAPLCVVCDDELETEADQTLVAIFREASRSYRQFLSNLADAAGGPDFDTFQELMRQCEKSRLECIELLSEMARRRSSDGRPGSLE
jgi:hypothetical protein